MTSAIAVDEDEFPFDREMLPDSGGPVAIAMESATVTDATEEFETIELFESAD